jgi:hypothetical protein
MWLHPSLPPCNRNAATVSHPISLFFSWFGLYLQVPTLLCDPSGALVSLFRFFRFFCFFRPLPPPNCNAATVSHSISVFFSSLGLYLQVPSPLCDPSGALVSFFRFFRFFFHFFSLLAVLPCDCDDPLLAPLRPSGPHPPL